MSQKENNQIWIAYLGIKSKVFPATQSCNFLNACAALHREKPGMFTLPIATKSKITDFSGQ